MTMLVGARELDLLPAVHFAGKAAGLLVHDRGLGIVHIALDQHAVCVARRLHRRPCDVVGADGALVHEGGVREIDEVVEQQHVVAVVDDAAVRVGPVGRVEPGQLGDERGIRLGRVAHPDPGELPALDERIGQHLGARRDARLTGDLDAFPAAVESQPVVAAAQASRPQRVRGKAAPCGADSSRRRPPPCRPRCERAPPADRGCAARAARS